MIFARQIRNVNFILWENSAEWRWRVRYERHHVPGFINQRQLHFRFGKLCFSLTVFPR